MFGHLQINLIQTGYDDRYFSILHFDTSLIDLELDSRSQECKKAKSSAPIISKSVIDLRSIWYTGETCWYDEPHTLLFRPFNIQWRDPYFVISWKKVTLDYNQTFTDRFLSNFVYAYVWWERRLHSVFWGQFGWPWPSFKVTFMWGIQNFGVYFLTNLCVNFLNEIQWIATTCWGIETHTKLILHKSYSRENSDDMILMKCTLNIVLCLDSCEPICFKLDMTLNSNKLSSLIWIRMTLMFTQGLRVTGKLDLYSYSVVKLHEATEIFMMLVM